VLAGRTTGAPISIMIENRDVDSSKYEETAALYRPSHADYTYEAKYGLRDHRGGGRASARETAARVAAGAIAEKLLVAAGVEIVAWVSDVGELSGSVDAALVTRAAVDASALRCPDLDASGAMEELICAVRDAHDSIGGCVRCVARGLPPGLGDPVFGKLESRLAGALLGIPAAKGFEIGSGFEATRMRGSENNDAFEMVSGRVRTKTNRSGGVQGGISNGEDLTLRVAFKPVSTISQPQQTLTRDGAPAVLRAEGRHDPCVLPRAVPIVEAMVSLVLVDALLAQRVARHD